MKKLLLLFAILVASVVRGQTFDFSCSVDIPGTTNDGYGNYTVPVSEGGIFVIGNNLHIYTPKSIYDALGTPPYINAGGIAYGGVSNHDYSDDDVWEYKVPLNGKDYNLEASEITLVYNCDAPGFLCGEPKEECAEVGDRVWSYFRYFNGGETGTDGYIGNAIRQSSASEDTGKFIIQDGEYYEITKSSEFLITHHSGENWHKLETNPPIPDFAESTPGRNVVELECSSQYDMLPNDVNYVVDADAIFVHESQQFIWIDKGIIDAIGSHPEYINHDGKPYKVSRADWNDNAERYGYYDPSPLAPLTYSSPDLNTEVTLVYNCDVEDDPYICELPPLEDVSGVYGHLYEDIENTNFDFSEDPGDPAGRDRYIKYAGRSYKIEQVWVPGDGAANYRARVYGLIPGVAGEAAVATSNPGERTYMVKARPRINNGIYGANSSFRLEHANYGLSGTTVWQKAGDGKYSEYHIQSNASDANTTYFRYLFKPYTRAELAGTAWYYVTKKIPSGLPSIIANEHLAPAPVKSISNSDDPTQGGSVVTMTVYGGLSNSNGTDRRYLKVGARYIYMNTDLGFAYNLSELTVKGYILDEVAYYDSNVGEKDKAYYLVHQDALPEGADITYYGFFTYDDDDDGHYLAWRRTDVLSFESSPGQKSGVYWQYSAHPKKGSYIDIGVTSTFNGHTSSYFDRNNDALYQQLFDEYASEDDLKPSWVRPFGIRAHKDYWFYYSKNPWNKAAIDKAYWTNPN